MDAKDLEKIIEYFDGKYPNPIPALKFGSNYQLLVAVMLSAQCTDARVNKVTEVLFAEYGTPEKMLTLTQSELEKYIFSCGLYHSKAKHILEATKDIIEKFGGEVPSEFAQLKSLSGVGQKTANVVWSVAFGNDAIAVDTHVFRVSNRIGLVDADTPFKTEQQLKALIPKEKWSKSHHYIIFHGREVCFARNPSCASCEINKYCKYYKNNYCKK